MLSSSLSCPQCSSVHDIYRSFFLATKGCIVIVESRWGGLAVPAVAQWVKGSSVAAAVVQASAEAQIQSLAQEFHMLWMQPKNKKKKKKEEEEESHWERLETAEELRDSYLIVGVTVTLC